MLLRSALIRTLAGGFALALLFGGCADDFGEPCDMPQTADFERLCGAGTIGDATTDATCVFSNNAQCSNRMCARYIGSRDFCTESCDPADPESCPGDAFCETIPSTGTGFCVPQSILESID